MASPAAADISAAANAKRLPRDLQRKSRGW
jgi:hypothetical protein